MTSSSAGTSDAFAPFSNGRSTINSVLAAPRVLYQAVSGPYTLDMARAQLAHFEQLLRAGGPAQVFTDACATPTAATDARELTTRWIERHGHQLELHILQRSALLEMAIRVVSLFARGRLHSYTDRAAFEAALRKQAPGFRPPA